MSQSPTVQSQHRESPPLGAKAPTFAEMARKGANKKPSVTILLDYAECGMKFYTQKGRSDHSAECKGTASTGRIDTEGKKLPTKSERTVKAGSGKSVVEKKKKEQGSWKRKPVRPVYCKYCDLKIFLFTTLEDHYLRRHYRQLSPQNEAPIEKKGKVGARTNQDTPKAKEGNTQERASTSTTPSNPMKAGKLAGRCLVKNFVCVFCDKRFATIQARDAHASAVHEVEDEITFAFKEEDNGRVTEPPERSEMVEEARSEQTAPGAQNVQQHGDRSPGNTPPAQTSTHVETKWCTHCAKYLGTKEKLAHHIKTKHNDVVVKKDDGKMHTKVVHFQLDDVADASNCSNTPAFNVLCPEDSDPCDTNPIPPGESHEGVLSLASRPQDGIPTPLREINVGASTSTSCPQDTNPIPPGEINVGASTSTGNPVQGLVKRSGHNCEQCGKTYCSWKALQYHITQAHGVRVWRKRRRRKKKGELNSASDSDQTQSPLKRRKSILLCKPSSPRRR
ncbi:hypothetical protein TNCV_4674201 [Trichonephila clavipes]|nr:hypothetical protein TNCV_4674201 [Trichonephila clavipes]